MPTSDSPFPIPHSRLFILVAGEASGDLLGAGLIEALRERFPDARFAGIGGPRMVAAGLDAWFPAERLAVMGLAEVLRHLPGLLRIRREVRRRTLALRPDAFIGIDAPDFNLALERKLKQAGIRTIHYVSPSIWAWREKRAHKIGRSADRVLCLFPMEPAVYARHGVDARFVGHPLADAFALEPDQRAAREALGIALDVPVLAMLPGSRLGEIHRLGADFIAAAALLTKEIPNLHVIAPMANAACRAAFASLLAKAGIGNGESGDKKSEADTRALALADSPFPIPDSRTTIPDSLFPIPDSLFPIPDSPFPIPDSHTTIPDSHTTIADSRFPILVLDGQSHSAMIAADAILLASGTAALEAMLAKRPMVVAYRLAALTYRIVKGFGLLKVERYSLPNHLAGREIVPELMQDRCTPQALADALRKPLLERRIEPELLAQYTRIHQMLRGDGNRNAATAVIVP